MENKVGQPTNQTTQMGRTVFETPDGQLVSELSKTVIINGVYVNVPSIIDGVEFDEDELVEKIFGKRNTMPSKYADRNGKEYFAENFAMYFMGRKEQVSPDIKELIERIMRQQNGIK